MRTPFAIAPLLLTLLSACGGDDGGSSASNGSGGSGGSDPTGSGSSGNGGTGSGSSATGSGGSGGCSSDGDCGSASFCDDGTCRSKGSSGASCAASSECSDGLTCAGGTCEYCDVGEDRVCQGGDFCTCGPTCSDASPDCGTGRTCARFDLRPTEGVCVDTSWLTARCGGCGPGETCNDQDQCEVVARPSTAVISAQATLREGATEAFVYDVTFQLVTFDADGLSTDTGTFFSEDFSVTDFALAWDSPDMTCQVTQIQAAAQTVSVPLVLDQSGSITGTDPGNLRIPAAREFLSSLTPADESIVLSFADGNPCSSFAVTKYGPGFSHDHASFFPTVDALAGCEGGGTPLFDAATAAVDLVVTEGVNDARAVVLFTDGEDTASTATEAQVIQDAVAGGVKIFSIGLSEGVNHQVLSNVAQRTSGAYFYAADVGSAISAFRGMNQLLTGSYHRYDCTNGFTVTVPAGQRPGYALIYLGVTIDGDLVQAPAYLSL